MISSTVVPLLLIARLRALWFVLVLVMKKRGVGSVTLSMDADKNVSVTGVDGKAAISNASEVIK